MQKKLFPLILIFILLSGLQQTFSFDQASVERLRRTNKCPGCDFFRANFNGMNLTGANLRGANLAYAQFRKATLYQANLEEADLRGTDFQGALWIDGTLCQKGSIGKCTRLTE